ncbi:Gfo/Idh/MocA family protein [Marinoscillum sp.]|uniref:Gfo/Idh/MocA family protein n=1 Tax=Marinoscillum sp. TaxID=2024838 RepID=UPI003BA8D8C8
MRDRKLRMGMVGGGMGAFIGAVHRMAANLDGQIELVCGAFSSDAKRSATSGRALFLPESRIYDSFEEMITKEQALPVGERMDFVSIVTPNVMHFAPAMMALENGFPVIIDKPLAFTLEEARALEAKVLETRLPFAVTYTYTGYPMVKQAMAMVRKGDIGTVRKVMVEYPQGWLSTKVEDTDQKQASWRADPARAGISNCFGDIGTHAANLAEYVSGLEITEVLSEIRATVPGRILDDDANVLLHFENGANGVLSASQVASGEENDLKIRIYGDKGGLEWSQKDLNTLIVKDHGNPDKIYRTGGDRGGYLYDEAMQHTRTPSGHPEGYIEAFANIYRNYAEALRNHAEGKPANPILDFPGIREGVQGMALVKAVVASTKNGNIWTKV